jgi:thymidylate kinase
MNRNRANPMENNDEIKRKAPRVVEVLGPAGAGKTTLCEALAHASGQIQLSRFPDVRKPADSPFFLWYGLQLLPTVLRLSEPGSRRLSRREFAWLSILSGWPALLQRELVTHGKIIVLDQGPVFLLTDIRESGPGYLRSQHAEKTWQALYGKWATMLDTIVWLDTADLCLLRRIRSRRKEHSVKEESAENVFEFLNRSRIAYQQSLSMLAAYSIDLRILRFDTDHEAPYAIAKELLIEFGLLDHVDRRS